MLRFLASTVIHLLANAVGLLVAATLVNGFSIDALSFIVVLLIFTAVEVVAGPLIMKITIRNAPILTGGIALVTTLVGLIITSIFTNGLQISGLNTWFIATLVIWICSVAATLLLPLFLFKKTLAKRKN